MRVFKDVGLVEQLGSGMSRILNAYSTDVFHIFDHFIKVVFPFSESVSENGDNNGDSKLILDILKETPEITAKELSMRSAFR